MNEKQDYWSIKGPKLKECTWDTQQTNDKYKEYEKEAISALTMFNVNTVEDISKIVGFNVYVYGYYETIRNSIIKIQDRETMKTHTLKVFKPSKMYPKHQLLLDDKLHNFCGPAVIWYIDKTCEAETFKANFEYGKFIFNVEDKSYSEIEYDKNKRIKSISWKSDDGTICILVTYSYSDKTYTCSTLFNQTLNNINITAPAVVIRDIQTDNVLSQIYYNAGLINRDPDIGAAMESYYVNGKPKHTRYVYNGLITREEGPAEVYYDEQGIYRQDRWYKDGKLHNENQPAVISYNSKGDIIEEEYFIDGVKQI